VLLGNLAQHHGQAALLHRLAHELAHIVGARQGFLGEAANSVGGYLAGAVPFGEPAGLNAREMLARPRRGYLLLNAEPELDCHDPRQALAAMRSAEFVVAMSAFRHRALDYAHVLLPIAPFTETAGSFVNTEGRLQSFPGVVRPLGETRPAWKVLRVLGSLLGLSGFELGSAEEVRAAALRGVDIPARLSNVAAAVSVGAAASGDAVQRIAEVPIYFADALVRRAAPLQQTADAEAPVAGMPGSLMERLGLREGDLVRVAQDGGETVLPAVLDERVPAGCVRINAAHPLTAELGGMFDAVELSRAEAAERAVV
jgi:NADH-quinone oxidoreductase subunit G